MESKESRGGLTSTAGRPQVPGQVTSHSSFFTSYIVIQVNQDSPDLELFLLEHPAEEVSALIEESPYSGFVPQVPQPPPSCPPLHQPGPEEAAGPRARGRPSPGPGGWVSSNPTRDQGPPPSPQGSAASSHTVTDTVSVLLLLS